jgi:hypothetical protein
MNDKKNKHIKPAKKFTTEVVEYLSSLLIFYFTLY